MMIQSAELTNSASFYQQDRPSKGSMNTANDLKETKQIQINVKATKLKTST